MKSTIYRLFRMFAQIILYVKHCIKLYKDPLHYGVAYWVALLWSQ